MTNSQGAVTATTPEAAPGEAPKPTDTSLPDPTKYALFWLLGLLIVAVAVGLVWNGFFSTTAPFAPSKNATANFALFAGFYVAAQVIERLLELVSPLVPSLLPGYELPTAVENKGESVKAAQLKADRAKIVLGLAAALGVAVSCGFGLYFLHAVGIDCSRTIDTLATGITIAAGTKPLHDLISAIQNQSTPTTGTGTT